MPTRRNEVHAKHQAVTRFLADRHLDAVVLTRRYNFAWFTAGGLNPVSTGGETGVASLVVTPDGVRCVTNTIEAPRIADEELEALGIEVLAYPWYDADAAAKLWSQTLGPARTACDAAIVGLPDTVKPLDPQFDRLRQTLTGAEIERYRRLAREVAEGLESACKSARPGMTEHELAAAIAVHQQARGIRAPVVLVAADERVRRYRHPIPTARKLTRYGMGVCCGERHGLIVSVTRLFAFGPIDDDLRRRHEAVCRVDAAMITATRPDRTLADVFTVAQKAYADAGFPEEWTYHHQGGSTGYQPREVRATPTETTPISANQAFAWNPSIAGTKSEDTILVGPDRNEILSATADWPTTPYRAADQTWPRGDILEI